MDEIRWSIKGSGGQVLVVEAPAELNHESAPGLSEVVRRRMPAVDGVGLVLDMSATEMISSIGITALLEAQEIFPNCPRYIPDLARQAASDFLPDDSGVGKKPPWKSFDGLRDALPENDPHKG